MLGRDFDTMDEFIEACKGTREPLDPGCLLARIYPIAQIRHIAKSYSKFFGKVDVHPKKMTRDGYGRRYQYAKEFGDIVDVDNLGQILSRLDHDFYFQFLSYARLKNVQPYSSAVEFLSILADRGIEVESGFSEIFNGLTKPSGRNCRLESIFVPVGENQVSLLYSCTRVLSVPDAEERTLENYFLARIPVLARIFFDQGIIECSLPFFSEPIAGVFESNNKMPIRYQIIIDRVLLELRNLIGYGFKAINLDTFSLYLETKYEANDMGWRILPQDEAAFDLTQGVIPLRDIMFNFSKELRKELEKLRIKHPLSDINLYNVFRAIRDRSYTYSLVLKVPYRKKSSHFLMSVIYGQEDSTYLPLLSFSRNNRFISRLIRECISDCQSNKIENPYDLHKLLS